VTCLMQSHSSCVPVSMSLQRSCSWSPHWNRGAWVPPSGERVCDTRRSSRPVRPPGGASSDCCRSSLVSQSDGTGSWCPASVSPTGCGRTGFGCHRQQRWCAESVCRWSDGPWSPLRGQAVRPRPPDRMSG